MTNERAIFLAGGLPDMGHECSAVALPLTLTLLTVLLVGWFVTLLLKRLGGSGWFEVAAWALTLLTMFAVTTLEAFKC